MTALRRIVPILSILLALSALSLADQAAKDLAASYKAMEKVIQKLDFKAFSSGFDKDFVLVDPDGKSTNLKGFLAMVRPMFEGSKSTKATIETKRVVVMGDYAEIQFVLDAAFTSKEGTTKIHEVGTDFLVKKNGKWVLYRTVEDKFEYSGPGGH